MRRDLSEPVKDPGVRIEVIGPERAHVRTTVQRASFVGSTLTSERWHAMAAGLPSTVARCLVAHDDQGSAVAAVTVWSAGAGKRGQIEPMGVRREQRNHGYAAAVALVAAAALQELGSSSAIVCTPASNVGALAPTSRLPFTSFSRPTTDAGRPRSRSRRWRTPLAPTCRTSRIRSRHLRLGTVVDRPRVLSRAMGTRSSG